MNPPPGADAKLIARLEGEVADTKDEAHLRSIELRVALLRKRTRDPRIKTRLDRLANRIADKMPEHIREKVGTTKPVTVERFATLDAPDVVRPGRRFAVEFSLTVEQETPRARVTKGNVSQLGELRMSLPPPVDGDAWELDVALRAPGFEIVDGKNLAKLRLPTHGDSTPVLFELAADEISVPRKDRRLRVSLWHRGVFLARIARPIVVAREAGRAKSGSAKAATTKTPHRAPVSLIAPERQADLTLYVLRDDARPDEMEVLLTSRLALSLSRTTWKTKGLSTWLESKLTALSGKLTRGRSADGRSPGGQSGILAARGFGRELFQRFAPPAFREQFWQLVDQLGDGFTSIEIHSDDPRIPWELMRPVRRDGSGERSFLGVEFDVGRWHVSPQAAVRERPPELIELRELVVIAPEYSGTEKLPAGARELAALRSFPGFRKIAGRTSDFASLMQKPPRGIIHFCGHGFAPSTSSGHRFAIQLEDGELDLSTWQGMAGTRLAAHPFFFFNACDIGRTKRVADFVDGWAPAALELGASGYVGALWPVHDAGAAAFAKSFYSKLAKQLEQHPAAIASVLRATRAERLAAGDATALAYAYYGDPHLRVAR